MNEKREVGRIGRNGMQVVVIDVEGATGYDFEAVDERSLSLAVDLAILQAQRGWEYVEGLLKGGVVRGNVRL